MVIQIIRRIVGMIAAEREDLLRVDSQRGINAKVYLFFCLLVIFFFLFFIYPICYLFPEHKTLRLFVDSETTAKGYMKVYYDDGKGFREKFSRMRILIGDYQYEFSKRFEKTVRAIRLDPIDHKGELIIRRVGWQWLGEKGSLKGNNLLKIIKPMKDVRVELAGKYLKVIALGDDPQLLINKRFKYSWWRMFKDSYMDIRYIGLLLLLGFTLWYFWHFCLLNNGSSYHLSNPDPIGIIKSRKREILYGAIFLVLAANLAFYDVLWTGHTMVSIPSAHFRGEPIPKSKGPYLIDPCAGENIEAPGLWFTHDALFKNKEVPFWNFYEGCGQPYLANGEVAALSLLQLPLHAKPSILNWNRYAVFRIFLAAFFTYIWLLSLQMRCVSALFGSIAFGFGAVFIGYANKEHPNASLFIPLIFLFVESLLYNPTWWRFWLLSLTIGLALNGGNPQPVVATSVFVGIRLLWNIRKGRKFIRSFALVLLAFLVGGALTSFTLFPLLEILTKSFSRGLKGELLLYAPWHPLLLFSPGDPSITVGWYWLGPSAALSSYLGFLFYKKKFALTPYFIGWIIYLSLIVRFPIIHKLWEFIIPKLPVYSSMAFFKYISPLLLISATFAATFLDILLDGNERRKLLFMSILVVILIVILWITKGGQIGNLTLFSTCLAIYSIAVFFVVFGSSKARLAALLPILILAEIAFIYPHHPENSYNTLIAKLSPVKFLEKKIKRAPYRFCGWDMILLPYTSSVFHISDMMLISPVSIKEYHSLLSMVSGEAIVHIPRANTVFTFTSPCLSFLGVKYVLSDIPIPKPQSEIFLDSSGILKEISVVKQKDLQIKKLYPFLFKGAIGIRGRVLFPGSKFIEKGYLYINIEETKGIKIIVGDKVFYRDCPGRIKVDLKPFLGKKILLSFESKDWSKLSLRFRARLVLSSPPSLNLVPVWSEGTFTVYENPHVKPIARFPSFVDFCGSWSALNTPEKICGDVIYLPENAKRVIPLRDCDRKVLGFRYVGLNSAEIRIENSCPSWLFVTINNDGNWRALVDGEEIPVFKAQKTFIAVPIKKTGRHVLMLSYRPKAFVIGVILSLFVIIFFMIGSLGLLLRDASSKGKIFKPKPAGIAAERRK